jgi:succinyl-diaminopimelate desuccinylase
VAGTKVLRGRGVPTVEFGFGAQSAHGTDEYTTTKAMSRNATAYALLPYEYAERAGGNRDAADPYRSV